MPGVGRVNKWSGAFLYRRVLEGIYTPINNSVAGLGAEIGVIIMSIEKGS